MQCVLKVIGGIVGEANNFNNHWCMRIENCTNTGEVTSLTEGNVGGIAGKLNCQGKSEHGNNLVVENCRNEEGYRQKYSEKDLFDEFTRDENGNVVLSEEDAHAKIEKLGGYDKLYRIKLEADYLNLEHLYKMHSDPHLIQPHCIQKQLL